MKVIEHNGLIRYHATMNSPQQSLFDTWLEQAKHIVSKMPKTQQPAKRPLSSTSTQITAALNRIYTQHPADLPPDLYQMQTASLPEEP